MVNKLLIDERSGSGTRRGTGGDAGVGLPWWVVWRGALRPGLDDLGQDTGDCGIVFSALSSSVWGAPSCRCRHARRGRACLRFVMFPHSALAQCMMCGAAGAPGAMPGSVFIRRRKQSKFLLLFQSDDTDRRYLSNQTSSSRKLLMMLLTIIVQFLT